MADLESQALFLDLNNMNVIYALSALDTEMNHLHNLCLEQGLFFKTFFPLAVSDSLRYSLKEHAPHQSPNASHLVRTFWKNKITLYEIEHIEGTYQSILKDWLRLYTILYEIKTQPIPGNNKEIIANGLSELHKNLNDMATKIFEICKYLRQYTITEKDGTETSNETEVFLKPLVSLDCLLHQLRTKL